MHPDPIDIGNKWPCCVIASPRSGSSAFAYDLAVRHNLGYSSCILEPNLAFKDQSHSMHAVDSKIAAHDYLFIVKFMIHEAHQHQTYRQLLSMPSYKIRLYRRNKIKQIASKYISEVMQKSFFAAGEEYEPYECQINLELIDHTIQEMTHIDLLLRDSQIQFDETIAYEDLWQLDTSWAVKTTQPENLEDIYAAVRDRLSVQGIAMEFSII